MKMLMKIKDWIDERFPLTETMERHLFSYPTPPNLNYWWAFGALLIFFLVLQVVTGVWLAMFYTPDVSMAFDSVERLMREVRYGWLIRYLHANGSNMIYFGIFLHIARGIYYGSYKKPRELLWITGILIFNFVMMESFMGYVLPWGQMSYWAGTVITSFASIIPFIGKWLVTIIRGDYALGNPTLHRFFSFHIAFLGIIVLMVFLHIVALHRVGSNNPEGKDILPKEKQIPFYPYYVVKDLFVIAFALTVFLFVVFFYQDTFLERSNHIPFGFPKPIGEIKPEWYFLPFFTVLRSIPSKVIGVIAMWGSINLLLFLPWLDRSRARSSRYRPKKRIMDIIFFINFFLLGWLATEPPLGLLSILGKISTIIHFAYFILLPVVTSYEKEEVIKKVREPVLKKKGLCLAFIILCLFLLNYRVFTSSTPDPDLIEKGRKVFQKRSIGREGHTMSYLESRYFRDRDYEEDFVGPDLSTLYRGYGEEFIRKVLRDCVEGTECPDKEMKNTLKKIKKGERDETFDALIAFFRYASNPFEEEQHKIGKWVVFYMSIFTIILYLFKDTFPKKKEE